MVGGKEGQQINSAWNVLICFYILVFGAGYIGILPESFYDPFITENVRISEEVNFHENVYWSATLSSPKPP